MDSSRNLTRPQPLLTLGQILRLLGWSVLFGLAAPVLLAMAFVALIFLGYLLLLLGAAVLT